MVSETPEIPAEGGMLVFSANGLAHCAACDWRGVPTIVDGETLTFCPVCERDPVAPAVLPGRNDPCWCGSDRKFKKCHGR